MVHLRVSPNPASVAVDNALHDGQADAAAWKLGSFMHTLKGAKEFLCVGHIKTSAIVTHEIDECACGTDGSGLFFEPKFNERVLLFAGELAGVLQQVGQHDLQKLRVPGDHRPWLNHKFDLAPSVGGFDARGD